ncbi:hypothetical protein ScPMuIL_003402 [Solemya velum]
MYVRSSILFLAILAGVGHSELADYKPNNSKRDILKSKTMSGSGDAEMTETEIIAMYEDIFKDRYTDSDTDYVECVKPLYLRLPVYKTGRRSEDQDNLMKEVDEEDMAASGEEAIGQEVVVGEGDHQDIMVTKTTDKIGGEEETPMALLPNLFLVDTGTGDGEIGRDLRGVTGGEDLPKDLDGGVEEGTSVVADSSHTNFCMKLFDVMRDSCNKCV